MGIECPKCGEPLTVVVTAPRLGAEARWSKATAEERAEQGRKMRAGKGRALPPAELEHPREPYHADDALADTISDVPQPFPAELTAREIVMSGPRTEPTGYQRHSPEGSHPDGCARHPFKPDPKCVFCKAER